jgi:putative DNA primase/helicase
MDGSEAFFREQDELARSSKRSQEITDDVSDDDLPYKGSEDEFAAEFSNRHSDKLRYVAPWGTWLQWDGDRWQFETTLAAFDAARTVAREFAKANKDVDIAKARTVAAIERLARADRRQAATIDQWDCDQWAFNRPIGEKS